MVFTSTGAKSDRILNSSSHYWRSQELIKVMVIAHLMAGLQSLALMLRNVQMSFFFFSRKQFFNKNCLRLSPQHCSLEAVVKKKKKIIVHLEPFKKKNPFFPPLSDFFVVLISLEPYP